MGLKTVYERFLATPNAHVLAENAVLQYVTTLTSYNKQSVIIRHLESQNENVVKKKKEKIVSSVEGLTSVAVVVETTLGFVSSGGAYLPNLDNFVVDREATLPVTHFVNFDQDEKITHIRLSWDQGDLLKQVEVIGSRSKNWPICEGKDQIQMIASSSSSAASMNPAPSLSPRGRAIQNEAASDARSMSPSKKYIKDPHASLDLFASQRGSEAEAERRISNPNAVAPREAARPAPREMSELFAAGHEDNELRNNNVRKENVVPPKGAGHKKFQPSRLFDDEEEIVKEKKIYKTNPARYNHFDIGDHDEYDPMQHRAANGLNSNQENVPIRTRTGNGNKNNNGSQWDFQDFYTPEKVKQKHRPEDVVHFSLEDSERGEAPGGTKQPKHRRDDETHFELRDAGTPVNRPIVHKARRDVQSHFDIVDEPSPKSRTVIARTGAAKGLYADNVLGEEHLDNQPLSSASGNTKTGGIHKNTAHKGFWDF